MRLWHQAIRIMVVIGFLVSAGIEASEPPVKTQPPAKTPSSKDKKKPAPVSPAGGGSQTTPAAGESQKKEDPGSSGLLDGLWNKVREMMIPDETADSSAPHSSAVAGVRGAKSDDATLKPIWKGQGAEHAVPPDARLYEEAKAHFTKAEYPEAVARLLELKKLYPLSPARPQAELLLALAYAKSNNSAEATKTLDEFLIANPGHPLAEEVKQLKAKLAGASPK